MGNPTWLDKLQEQLKIDIDCVDPAEAKRFLPFKPYDQTSNQSIIHKELVSPKNRELLLKTVDEGKDEGWEVILDRMAVLLCAQNIENLQGRVLLQSSPFHAYDTEKVLAHARSYAREFEKAGIPRDRFCIKIPATGPALNASPILLQEGIRTLGTSLFSVAQAIAASQAGCLFISPYYNMPWFHTDKANQWPDYDDPALEHPMSSRILQIMQVYKLLREETGKDQPMVKAASFLSAKEAMAIGEFGCEYATIPEDVLLHLSTLDAVSNPPPGNDSPKKTGTPSPRVAHLVSTDPFVGPNWDGKLAATDVDYLADNGALLEDAIAADPLAIRGVRESLEMFQASELKSRAVIEELLKEV